MSTSFQTTFDWDPSKAVANRRKHGVGFEQAATVFRAPLAVSIYDEDHSDQEVSPTEAAIRLSSARPATQHEQRDYEQGT